MIWLTRIRLDHGVAFRLRLYDNYAWHKAAWEVFPGRDGTPRNFLSRLNTRPGGFELLLLSEEPPERPSWCPDHSYGHKAIPLSFFDYQRYRFDLRANPTRKVSKLDKNGNLTKNGRRQALLRPEDQFAWLARKADDSGFRVLDSPPVVADPTVSHIFRIPKTHRSGLHLGVTFRGLLEVTNREQFQETCLKGIGSAKAFGFGMLLLKPAS
jgi:CRISPR system Cascade subunit CasE